ncbi:MAG TPA: IMP dehydrogenase [Gaiellales bacterium]|nr:IMP dehydrogenase [Gaiellales bacterium]
MTEPFEIGLTFDDVLLVPRRSAVSTRRQVSTRTQLCRGIELAIPVVSASMDTVTEGTMAIAMAREGGIGIIHRFLTIEEHVAHVRRVKRAESVVIDAPYTLPPDATVGQAAAFMDEHGSAGILVIDRERRVLGIVTARDVLFEDGAAGRPITTVMTPRERLITAPAGTPVEEAKQILHRHRIEKLPLVDQAGRLVGLISSRDIQSRLRFPQATKDARGRLRVGAAIGVRGDYLERAEALVAAEVDTLVIDIAHGHSDLSFATIEAVRKRCGNVPLIAGNVATAEGTRDLIARGVDGVKVGVGPGSTCTTRVVTGAGVPQLTAILECAQAAAGSGVPVIGDGGIRGSGDLVKALAAGAATVMLGNLLAGTEESPGASVNRNGRQFKLYRGMASLWASAERRDMPQEDDLLSEIVPEGVEALVPYRGRVASVLAQLVGGLRSGMSYCGATTVAELRTNARFIRMTDAGVRESMPHDVDTLT